MNTGTGTQTTILAELTRMLGLLTLGVLFMWLILLWTGIVSWSWQGWTGMTVGIVIGAVVRWRWPKDGFEGIGEKGFMTIVIGVGLFFAIPIAMTLAAFTSSSLSAWRPLSLLLDAGIFLGIWPVYPAFRRRESAT